MGLTERRQQLLATERWSGIGAFVERWYAQPMSDEDGYSPEEIALVAQRIGMRLPAALTEWHELVGKRLRAVQDSPTLLDALSVEDGHVPIWTENQGVWTLLMPVDAGDDPMCRLDDESFVAPDAPLSQTLLGMLVSETLIGTQRHVGTLGELRASVRGGYFEYVDEQMAQRVSSVFEKLRYMRNPFFTERYRGDETTIVRIQEIAIEWITATDSAFGALDDLLDLMPEDGDNEVVAAFDADAVAQPALRIQLPRLDSFSDLLAGVGHVSIATMAGQVEVRCFHITTKQPRRVLALILDAISPTLLPHLTVATRPVAVNVFEVLYPEARPTSCFPRRSTSE